LEIVKGWFPESFKGLEHIRWRFVHIDLVSTDKNRAGNILGAATVGRRYRVHDYGCYSFQAARMAVDEFCNAVGVLPTEMPDRWGSAVIRKPLSAGPAM
jgi:hypothetical protein